jgi:hypothetical protein
MGLSTPLSARRKLGAGGILSQSLHSRGLACETELAHPADARIVRAPDCAATAL